MKYIWDTDICVYFLNGDKEIVNKTKAIGAENICTSIISILELKFGAYNSTRVKSNLERIGKLQQKLTILDDFDDNIAAFFAGNKAQSRKKGITIGDFDLLIASFASVNNLYLVTNNTKHFKHLSRLKIENWLPKNHET